MTGRIKKRFIFSFPILTFLSFVVISIIFASLNLYGQVDKPEGGVPKLAGLEASLARAENQEPSTSEDMNQIKREKDDLTIEIENLKKYTSDLESSIDTMRQGIQKAQKMAESSEDTGSMKDDSPAGAGEYKRDMGSVSQPVRSTQTSSATGDLISDINQLKAYVRDLEANISRAKRAGFKFDGKETDFDRVLKENDNLRGEVISLREQVRGLESKMSLMKETNIKLEARMDDYYKLVSQRDDLLADTAKLKREIQSAVSAVDFERLKSERDILASENANLRQMNEKLDTSISLKLKEASLRFDSILREHEAALVDIKKERAYKEDLARQLEGLKKANSELEIASRDTIDLRLRLDTKTREMEDVKRQKDELTSDVARLRLQAESLVKKEDLERLRIEKDALDRDIFNLKRRLNEQESKVAEFTDENSRLKVKLNSMEGVSREREGLLDQLNSVKRRSGDLETEISTLRDSNLKLEAKTVDTDKFAKERSSLYQEINGLRSELNESRKEKEAVEKEMQDLRNYTSKVEASLAALRGDSH